MCFLMFIRISMEYFKTEIVFNKKQVENTALGLCGFTDRQHIIFVRKNNNKQTDKKQRVRLYITFQFICIRFPDGT